jgi:TonB family protein
LPRWTPSAFTAMPINVVATAARAAAPTIPWGRVLWLTVAALLLARLALSFVWVWLHRDQVSAPLTFGIVRPEILLPASAARWSEELRRSVILHERSHIDRKDLWAHLFSQAICACLWFQPLAWYAARRAAAERERACDDMVLDAGVDAISYAGHLLEIARLPGQREAAALAMAQPSSLELRIKAILDSATPRRAPSRGVHIALVALALVSVVGVIGLRAQAIPIGPGVTAPVVVEKVDPAYTQEAKDAQLQGTVLLAMEIDTDGLAQNIQILRGLGLGLDENAVAAITKWRFKPGIRDGKPVAVAVRLEVNFRLQ